MDEPLITIFNGRRRSLGQGGQISIYAQVSVQLRQYLHCFRPLSTLPVFFCIAFHADADGWAWPSLDLLRKETGLNKETISLALNRLDELLIADYRVLLTIQLRGENGTFASNRYLIFPSLEEIAYWESTGRTRKPRAPRPENPVSVAPVRAEPSRVNHDERKTTVKKNHHTEEPSAPAGAGALGATGQWLAAQGILAAAEFDNLSLSVVEPLVHDMLFDLEGAAREQRLGAVVLRLRQLAALPQVDARTRLREKYGDLFRFGDDLEGLEDDQSV